MQTALKEQHENWKAARERLFRPAAKPEPREITRHPIVKSGVERPMVVTPLWKCVEMHFDWHVKVWREMTLEHKLSELAHENAAMRAALRIAEADMAMLSVPRRMSKEIIDEVLAAYPGITFDQIRSRRREHRITGIKHKCMVAVYLQRPDMSLPQIGRLFNVDHTTVLWAVRKHEAANGNEESARWVENKCSRAREWHHKYGRNGCERGNPAE